MRSGVRTPVETTGLPKPEIAEGPPSKLRTVCQLRSFGAPLKMTGFCAI